MVLERINFKGKKENNLSGTVYPFSAPDLYGETKNAQPHTPGRHLYSHLPTHTLMSLHLHTNTEKQHQEKPAGSRLPVYTTKHI